MFKHQAAYIKSHEPKEATRQVARDKARVRIYFFRGSRMSGLPFICD